MRFALRLHMHVFHGASIWNVAADVTGPVFQGGRLVESYYAQKAFWDETIARYRATIVGAVLEARRRRAGPEVLAMAKATAARCEAMFVALVKDAQAQGQMLKALTPRKAARFLYTVLQGPTVRAQAGATAAELDDAARLAVQALT